LIWLILHHHHHLIIFICSDKIHDANKEQMIKPEQDSKVEKPHLLLPLNRKRKRKKKNTKFA